MKTFNECYKHVEKEYGFANVTSHDALFVAAMNYYNTERLLEKLGQVVESVDDVWNTLQP